MRFHEGIGAGTLWSLAEEFGTPLIVYDVGTIRSRYARMKRAFGKADVHYACKANPSPPILSVLRGGLGAGIDASTVNEAKLSLSLALPVTGSWPRPATPPGRISSGSWKTALL
ncbi:hypothetical protein [Thermogymnomonas acidicola]|uniref:hypothetical protein n=1 Tax=Thermogymnomonas acidicola TaxID=399579 RepID=UPI0013967FDB|nr:hypothetical protein [Thermogymnomonas acidicola]